MAGRTWNRVGICAWLEPGDVVDLQSQHVTEAVGQERRRDPAVHGLVGADLQHSRLAQEPCDQVMGRQVQCRPFDARRNGRAQFLLQAVYPVNQCRESSRPHGPGSGDVTAVSPATGSRVNQQRQ